MSGPRADVAVAGGGVIGLSIAWRAAVAGMTVALVDPTPACGASWAAAGMLAPVTEAYYGEEALLRLNLASAQRWPSFAAELTEATGHSLGFHPDGTIMVAMDVDDAAVLAELCDYQQKLDLSPQRLRGRQARELEPLLAPSVRGGMLARADHRVDPREVTAALRVAVHDAGVRSVERRAVEVVGARGRVTGLRLDDGAVVEAGQVVVAAGCWSARIVGVPDDVARVRPIKGQILTLRAPDRRLLGRTVRGLVHGRAMYLVPRDDGRLVIGATVEERGFDTVVTAGAVTALLNDAAELVPGIAELELLETMAGLRPGSPDNAPLIGASGMPGLWIATGHQRGGMLLAPLTADAVTAMLTDGGPPPELDEFTPLRFAATGSDR